MPAFQGIFSDPPVVVRFSSPEALPLSSLESYPPCPAMAETLGVVSGIIAVADLTYTVLRYLKSAHDAGKEIQDYNREAPNFAELLTSLAVHVTQSGGQNGDPWFESVQTLQRGPMQQYQTAVETFKEKVAPRTGFRENFTQRMTWKFVKDDVKEILEKMERLKSLVVIALQKDHLLVFSFPSKEVPNRARSRRVLTDKQQTV